MFSRILVRMMLFTSCTYVGFWQAVAGGISTHQMHSVLLFLSDEHMASNLIFFFGGQNSQVFWSKHCCDACFYLYYKYSFIYLTRTIKNVKYCNCSDFIVSLWCEVHFETIFQYYIIYSFFLVLLYITS